MQKIPVEMLTAGGIMQEKSPNNFFTVLEDRCKLSGQTIEISLP
jgi:hypothetical protein